MRTRRNRKRRKKNERRRINWSGERVEEVRERGKAGGEGELSEEGATEVEEEEVKKE